MNTVASYIVCCLLLDSFVPFLHCCFVLVNCCMFCAMDTAVVLLLYTASCGNASSYVLYMFSHVLCLWTPLAVYDIPCNAL